MENVFIKYIDQGKIRNLSDLKRCYRQIVMKTHPDAVGSDRLVEQYIEYSNFYAEAKERIAQELSRQESATGEDGGNFRLLFYKEYYRLERIDKPFAFNKYYVTPEEIESTKRRAFQYFSRWKADLVDLYRQANDIYDRIKKEKPMGPYRKYALLFNLSPVFHNILSYQLTGLQFYKKQLRQNFAGVMYQLEQRKLDSLIEYIQFLIDDLEQGPVILESN